MAKLSRPAVIRALIWKETRELARDRKFLATIIASPILSLLAIAFFTTFLLQYQPIHVAVVSLDSGEAASWFTTWLSKLLRGVGLAVEEGLSYEHAIRDVRFDLIVVVPEGFSENLTSISRVAYIHIVKRAGAPEERLSRAEESVKWAVSVLSTEVSKARIRRLGELAGVGELDPEAIRNPVQVATPVYIVPTGEPAKPEDILRPFIARLLILSLSFIVTPASTYIVDGIVGERERKTMEMLLSTPAGLVDLVLSKLFTSSLIGLIASASDVAGLVLYFSVLILSLGWWFWGLFDLALIALHAISAFLSILVTVSISLPFIARVKGIKTASNIAGLFSIMALAFFVAGWVVDFYKLPPTIQAPLMVAPFTHSILVIQGYVYGDTLVVARSIAILIALSALFLYLSLKTLDREKVLLAT